MHIISRGSSTGFCVFVVRPKFFAPKVDVYRKVTFRAKLLGPVVCRAKHVEDSRRCKLLWKCKLLSLRFWIAPFMLTIPANAVAQQKKDVMEEDTPSATRLDYAAEG